MSKSKMPSMVEFKPVQSVGTFATGLCEGIPKDFIVVIIITSIIIGLEELVIENLFECPCYGTDLKNLKIIVEDVEAEFVLPPTRLAYGVLYIVAPAIVLFAMGYYLSGNRKSKKTKASFMLIPCMIWFFAAFLDGRYVACAQTPIPFDCIPKEGWTPNTLKHMELEYKKSVYNAQSQIGASIGMIVVAIVFSSVTALGRNCFKKGDRLNLLKGTNFKNRSEERVLSRPIGGKFDFEKGHEVDETTPLE